MRQNAIRGGLALALLLAAAGCKATTPRLPTGPSEPGQPVPPSSGFLAPAVPPVYV